MGNWATRPCAVSVEECSVGRRTGNAGLEMKNIYRNMQTYVTV